jgi:DNA-3-methyladenine glycosylase
MMTDTRDLSRAYFERPTPQVARDLLGKVFVFEGPAGRISGRITETEAYCGPDDQASHAARGRTPRTAVMFGPAGYSYVYLIYGMYHCFNIVTEAEGYPAAVLIRGVAPLEGVERLGGNPELPLPRRTDGPGKFCRAFGLTRAHNGLDLCGRDSPIRLSDDGVRPDGVVTGPRVGVPYAGAWQHKPWRFIAGGWGSSAS